MKSLLIIAALALAGCAAPKQIQTAPGPHVIWRTHHAFDLTPIIDTVVWSSGDTQCFYYIPERTWNFEKEKH